MTFMLFWIFWWQIPVVLPYVWVSTQTALNTVLLVNILTNLLHGHKLLLSNTSDRSTKVKEITKSNLKTYFGIIDMVLCNCMNMSALKSWKIRTYYCSCSLLSHKSRCRALLFFIIDILIFLTEQTTFKFFCASRLKDTKPLR